jgi:hypothetical protein
MFKRMNPIVAAALCGLTLSFLTAPAAHADPKAVAQARATGDPTVNIIIDSAQGTQLNNQAAASVGKQFAGTAWLILDNRQVLIARGDKLVIDPVPFFASTDLDFFLLHGRGPKMSLDGTIVRWGDNLEEGLAELFVTQPASDGRSSVTFHIQVPLSFAPEGGSSGGSSGGPGGFGG